MASCLLATTYKHLNNGKLLTNTTMGSEQDQFHIFFFPFMAPGHMIPTLDMARLFATRGIKSNIVTTPANASFFDETSEIEVLTIKFPSQEVGLPEGYENMDSLSSPDMFPKILGALSLFQHPFENLVEEFRPNCLVVDSFFHWANSTASKFGIPCLSFDGSSCFSQCIFSNIFRYKPHEKISSDSSESFIVPGNLPHEIRLRVSELSPFEKGIGPKALLDLQDQIREAQKSYYGTIMNSFYELEPSYVDYLEKELGIKNWHIGPVSLYFKGTENGTNHRGKKSGIEVISKCMSWLDGKEPNSVIYICFGSISNVPNAQLHEIAVALESLGQSFILVVGKKDTKEWTPEGLEDKVKDQGLIIRGWAPQSQILDHPAISGFVTHCGWNSILDGVISGVPMLTWPLHAEQFYNEKLITDVLKIGIQVGSKTWLSRSGDGNEIIDSEKILQAMKELMVGEEAQDLRNRVKELKEMARGAVSQGGSSCSELTDLIEELKAYNKN